MDYLTPLLSPCVHVSVKQGAVDVQLRGKPFMHALLIWHLSDVMEGTGLYERWLIVLICVHPSYKGQHGKGAGEWIHSSQGCSCAR